MNSYLENYQIFTKEKYTIFAETETKSPAIERVALFALNEKKVYIFQEIKRNLTRSVG